MTEKVKQRPQGWNSIPTTPPADMLEFYGDQFSLPVLLHDGYDIMPVVARWSFIEDGWVGAQFSDGASPSDHKWLNEKARHWRLLSLSAPAAVAPAVDAGALATNEQIEALKRAAHSVTPQDIDSAESIDHYEDGSHVECPACGGEGNVPRESEFCNYDGQALGVQFYGIGNAVGSAEAFLRAAKPAILLALIDRLERAEAALSARATV